MGEVSTIGLDIAKSVFQIHGVDADGAVVIRKRITRAKLLPLKVTSCGLSSAILSQKAVISCFSVLSPTWGAPMASTAQWSGSRCAMRAPIQTIEW